MNDVTTARFFLLLCQALLLLSISACSDHEQQSPIFLDSPRLSGRVVKIADGDSLTLLTEDKTQVKVRLAEIDTPERKQPWGNRAKQALAGKVFRQDVTVIEVDTDRYGRTVGHVLLGDRHINREMVREGHAWVYRKYMEDPTLLDDEAHAKQVGVGIWSLAANQQVPPWDWRKQRRGK